MIFKRVQSDQRLLAVLLLMMGLACWSVAPAALNTLRRWNVQTTPSWIVSPAGDRNSALSYYDLDTWLIHGGLVAAPRFQDTLRWWVGPWAGQIPFYRPIPSMFFWIEWKLFGDREIRYLAFAIFLHLLVVYQFLRAAGDLAGHFRAPSTATAALLADLVFLNGINILALQSEINEEVAGIWKNQPDSLCALFLLLCVRSYLHVLRADEEAPPRPLRPTAARSRLFTQIRGLAARWAPLGWYLACCASKETGVFLPLLLPLLEWPSLFGPDQNRRKAAACRLVPLLAALPFFLLFRAHCLHTMTGFAYGSNGRWRDRLMADVLGSVSRALMHGDRLTIGVSTTVLVLVGAIVARIRRCARPVTLAELLVWATAALGMFWLMSLWALGGQVFSALGLAGALWMVSEPACRVQVLSVLLTLLALYGAFRLSVRLVLFSFGWAVLCLVINSFSPPVLHRYYLTNIGFALSMGMGLSMWLVQAKSWLDRRSRQSVLQDLPVAP